ncbi:unnamed protein product, partial [Pylaiella littoralis]
GKGRRWLVVPARGTPIRLVLKSSGEGLHDVGNKILAASVLMPRHPEDVPREKPRDYDGRPARAGQSVREAFSVLRRPPGHRRRACYTRSRQSSEKSQRRGHPCRSSVGSP